MAIYYATMSLSPQYFRANTDVALSINCSQSHGADVNSTVYVKNITSGYVQLFSLKAYAKAPGTYKIDVSGIHIRGVRVVSSNDEIYNTNETEFYVVADPVITSLTAEVVDVATHTVNISMSCTGNFNSSWSLEWGDSSPNGNFSGNSGTLQHVYPKNGQYIAKLTITNRVGISVTQLITVEILEEPISIFGDPDVRLCSLDGIVKGVLDRVEYIRYHKTFNQGDTFEIAFNSVDSQLESILEDDLLLIPVQSLARACVIDTISDNGDVCTISGREYTKALFDQRMCLTGINSGTGYDIQSGIAETLLRYFMVVNLPSGSRANNSWVIEGDNELRGGNTSYSARLETTEGPVDSLLQASGLGYDSSLYSILPRESVLIGASIIQGVDRRCSSGTTNEGAVFLSPSWGTGKMTSFERQRTPNVCYAGDGKSGSSRSVVAVGDTAATGIRRYEMFADCKEAATTADLEAMGRRALDSEKLLSIGYQLLPGSAYRFAPVSLGGNFYVGDLITLDCGRYGVFDARLTEAEMTWTNQGEDVSLTFGDISPGLVSAINETRGYIKDARR